MDAKAKTPENKNLIQKLQDKIPDRSEQFEYIGIAVRLIVVFWSGSLVTLNYLPKIPGLTSGEKQDITFPASLLSSSLLSFGLEKAAKSKGESSSNKKTDLKAELKELLGDTEIIRIKHEMKLIPEKTKIDPISGREIDLQSGRLKP